MNLWPFGCAQVQKTTNRRTWAFEMRKVSGIVRRKSFVFVCFPRVSASLQPVQIQAPRGSGDAESSAGPDAWPDACHDGQGQDVVVQSGCVRREPLHLLGPVPSAARLVALCPLNLRSGLCERSIKVLKPTDDRPGGACDRTNLTGLAAKGRCLKMRQPWPAEEVTSSTRRPRQPGKGYEKEQGREPNVVRIAARKVRSMPEADHGSAAAKYFLTRSLVVRTCLLVLAGPDSAKPCQNKLCGEFVKLNG